MKLFLSYPSAERTLAERLALALEAEGHEVFIDRSDLPAGEAFHQRLRQAIEAADAMVFLVTPAAVAPGSYTLAELDIARQRWRRPGGHVLPVVVAATPIATLPPYLAAVTLLQPRGELVAETVAAVARLGSGRRGQGAVVAAVALVVALALGIAGWQLAQRRAAEQAEREAALAAERQHVAQAQELLPLCTNGQHDAVFMQLGELAGRSPLPAVLAAREDCAMRWLREMRASSGQRSFTEQVARVQPVLLQGLAAAQGRRAADLRAHLGWGDFLRRREGAADADPVPHFQRALGDEPGNVHAHAMWARALLPARLDEARPHFEQALAGGRERAFVRLLQFGGSLGSSSELAAYAVSVADAMRRSGETVAAPLRQQLWRHAFGTRLLAAEDRAVLRDALPAQDLLATFEWLFPDAELAPDQLALRRFAQATLQAQAGQSDSARATFTALAGEMRAAGQSGRLLDETQRALAALK